MNMNHLKQIKQGPIFGPDRNNLQENFDVIENVTPINGDYFIAQIFNRKIPGSKDRRIIKTYIIDFKTGEGIFVSTSLPKILAVNFKKQLYVTFDESSAIAFVYKF